MFLFLIVAVAWSSAIPDDLFIDYTKSGLFASLPSQFRELEPAILTSILGVELFRISPRRVRFFNRLFEIKTVSGSKTFTYDLFQSSMIIIRDCDGQDSFIIDLKAFIGLKFKGTDVLFNPSERYLGFISYPCIHFWYDDSPLSVELFSDDHVEKVKFQIGLSTPHRFVSVTLSDSHSLAVEWGDNPREIAAALSMGTLSMSVFVPVLWMLTHRLITGESPKSSQLRLFALSTKIGLIMSVLLHKYLQSVPRRY